MTDSLYIFDSDVDHDLGSQTFRNVFLPRVPGARHRQLLRLLQVMFVLQGFIGTVDGQKSGDHHLRLVVYPIIYKTLHIPGGCLGFLPSTVGCLFLD